MFFRKIFSIVAIFFFTCGSCFAGELFREQMTRYYNEGLCQQDLGKYLEARTAYQKALLLGVDNKDLRIKVLNKLGFVYAKQGEYLRAEIVFNEAFELVLKQALDKEYASRRVAKKSIKETSEGRVRP